jgi:hypothetical protein
LFLNKQGSGSSKGSVLDGKSPLLRGDLGVCNMAQSAEHRESLNGVNLQHASCLPAVAIAKVGNLQQDRRDNAMIRLISAALAA